MTQRFYSTGEVARRLGLKPYQLNYLLETDQVEEPSLRVAGKRVWTQDELDCVGQVLYQRDRQRECSKKADSGGS